MKTNETSRKIVMMLSNTICIPKEDYDDLIERINDYLPILKDLEHFTILDLYEDHKWRSKSRYRRRVLGKTMAYLVDKDFLPFEFVKDNCRTPKRYRFNRL